MFETKTKRRLDHQAAFSLGDDPDSNKRRLDYFLSSNVGWTLFKSVHNVPSPA
jgi:hypothetical protein